MCIRDRYSKVKPEEMTGEMRFREDLGFTSLDFMSFLGELEAVSYTHLDVYKRQSTVPADQIHQEKQIRQGNNTVRWLCEVWKLSQKLDFKQSGSWSYPLRCV